MRDATEQARGSLTVIIATYNGARKLGRALDALASQVLDGVDLEVIVVNDGSTDETAAIADRPGISLIDLSANQGKGRALNEGIRAARGEFVATMDDDCVPEETWVQSLMAAWSSVDVDVTMIGGSIVPFATDTFNRRYVDWRVPLHPQEAELHDRAGLGTRVRTALLQPKPATGERFVYFVVGANMSMRSAAARAIGGFEEAPGIGGDEESIVRRLRTRYGPNTVRFFPGIVMRHDFEAGLSDSFRRARTYGRANGRSWAHEHDLPSTQPIPTVLVALSVVAAMVSSVFGLLALGLLPPLAYRGWLSKVRSTRKLETLTYPYVRVVEDLSDNVGFVQGAIAELRALRDEEA